MPYLSKMFCYRGDRKMSKNKKNILYVLISILIVFVFGLAFPTGYGLTREGLWCLGIFFAALVLWAGIAISWPSLIVLLLLGFLPSLGFQNVFLGPLCKATPDEMQVFLQKNGFFLNAISEIPDIYMR